MNQIFITKINTTLTNLKVKCSFYTKNKLINQNIFVIEIVPISISKNILFAKVNTIMFPLNLICRG